MQLVHSVCWVATSKLYLALCILQAAGDHMCIPTRVTDRQSKYFRRPLITAALQLQTIVATWGLTFYIYNSYDRLETRAHLLACHNQLTHPSQLWLPPRAIENTIQTLTATGKCRLLAPLLSNGHTFKHYFLSITPQMQPQQRRLHLASEVRC